MTTPKIATKYQNGSRFYLHPKTGDKVPGVTSVLGMLPKGFLKAWAAKMVAEEAVALATLADGDPGPSDLERLVRRGAAGAVDYLKRAPERNTREAADIGTGAHGVFEALALGHPLGPITDSLQIYARQYEDLLSKVDVKALRTEDTVWSETHDYAGSFDLLAEVQGTAAWIDNKTTRSGVHAEVALQLAAYKNADYIIDPESGEPLPMPKADHGLVFHIRPEGWAIYHVPVTDQIFDYFLTLRKTFTWDQISRQVVGRPSVVGAATVVEAGAA